jgi:hypothetical protein
MGLRRDISLLNHKPQTNNYQLPATRHILIHLRHRLFQLREILVKLAGQAESEVARIRTASRAALAPLSMPTVATGTPAGICTIEYSESMPLIARVNTGTPITGSTVSDAIIPGRWAAPPAAAMMT